MWSQSEGHIDRELSLGGLAYERSHWELENCESRGLMNVDIANAEIVMSEIPIRSGPLISVIGESGIGNSIGMCMITSKMPKPR